MATSDGKYASYELLIQNRRIPKYLDDRMDEHNVVDEQVWLYYYGFIIHYKNNPEMVKYCDHCNQNYNMSYFLGDKCKIQAHPEDRSQNPKKIIIIYYRCSYCRGEEDIKEPDCN